MGKGSSGEPQRTSFLTRLFSTRKRSSLESPQVETVKDPPEKAPPKTWSQRSSGALRRSFSLTKKKDDTKPQQSPSADGAKAAAAADEVTPLRRSSSLVSGFTRALSRAGRKSRDASASPHSVMTKPHELEDTAKRPPALPKSHMEAQAAAAKDDRNETSIAAVAAMVSQEAVEGALADTSVPRVPPAESLPIQASNALDSSAVGDRIARFGGAGRFRPSHGEGSPVPSKSSSKSSSQPTGKPRVNKTAQASSVRDMVSMFDAPGDTKPPNKARGAAKAPTAPPEAAPVTPVETSLRVCDSQSVKLSLRFDEFAQLPRKVQELSGATPRLELDFAMSVGRSADSFIEEARDFAQLIVPYPYAFVGNFLAIGKPESVSALAGSKTSAERCVKPSEVKTPNRTNRAVESTLASPPSAARSVKTTTSAKKLKKQKKKGH